MESITLEKGDCHEKKAGHENGEGGGGKLIQKQKRMRSLGMCKNIHKCNCTSKLFQMNYP